MIGLAIALSTAAEREMALNGLKEPVKTPVLKPIPARTRLVRP
jgi:hypothetical protein